MPIFLPLTAQVVAAVVLVAAALPPTQTQTPAMTRTERRCQRHLQYCPNSSARQHLRKSSPPQWTTAGAWTRSPARWMQPSCLLMLPPATWHPNRTACRTRRSASFIVQSERQLLHLSVPGCLPSPTDHILML